MATNIPDPSTYISIQPPGHAYGTSGSSSSRAVSRGRTSIGSHTPRDRYSFSTDRRGRVDRKSSQARDEHAKELTRQLEELRKMLAEADKARISPRPSQPVSRPRAVPNSVPKSQNNTTNMKSAFCPCIVQGYTAQRLNRLEHGKAALGLDAEECSSSYWLCFSSVPLCLYSLPIYSHRKKIAARYGLRVTADDWLGICVEPCCAIHDNDEYIILREAKKLRESKAEAASGRPGEYVPHPPMAVPATTRGGSVFASTAGTRRSSNDADAHPYMSQAVLLSEMMPRVPEEERVIPQPNGSSELPSAAWNVPSSHESEAPRKTNEEAEVGRRQSHDGIGESGIVKTALPDKKEVQSPPVASRDTIQSTHQVVDAGAGPHGKQQQPLDDDAGSSIPGRAYTI
ncbi:hypothetical protein SODALDRAFT_323472 [Sodiomyces alkalinus F11]|uniref:Uncharacterized protein n=1 Tax=Sodiomyces alkalinus (strain CBS 110278 / VKM F-3762 / F11) TaxID=1314773 RepID=A0A3N2PWV9_SODAK|nr:hypothetical protein SODALDRAFT_323472 [Sodiomyces alkalinus F11]ROT38988.1 hypothetical protein SODALDRAFT_323472 [Sodiomyces alkalinus F11]